MRNQIKNIPKIDPTIIIGMENQREGKKTLD